MKSLVRFALGTAILCPLLGIVFSCSEEADCSMTARPMVTCNMYTIDPNNVVKNDTLDSLTVTAYGTDSVIINRMQKVHVLSLPLNYGADSTKLIFHYSKKTADTVVIRHTNTPYFLSMDCGYQMKQDITQISYTRSALDSIYISNKEAGIYGRKNLELFY